MFSTYILKRVLGFSALGVCNVTVAQAASTAAPTGVNAGFFALQADLTSILQGDGGAAIIVAGVLIGAGMLAFSSRWTYIVSVLGVAVVLGYGFPVISSMAGVSADVDMISALELSDPEHNTQIALPAASAPQI